MYSVCNDASCACVICVCVCPILAPSSTFMQMVLRKEQVYVYKKGINPTEII